MAVAEVERPPYKTWLAELERVVSLDTWPGELQAQFRRLDWPAVYHREGKNGEPPFSESLEKQAAGRGLGLEPAALLRIFRIFCLDCNRRMPGDK